MTANNSANKSPAPDLREAPEREAFEKWAADQRMSIQRNDGSDDATRDPEYIGSDYLTYYTSDCWKVWLARAALASQPVQPLIEIVEILDGLRWASSDAGAAGYRELRERIKAAHERVAALASQRDSRPPVAIQIDQAWKAGFVRGHELGKLGKEIADLSAEVGAPPVVGSSDRSES